MRRKAVIPPGQELISREQLRVRVEELARQITLDYRDKRLVMIGVLKGAFIFTADLCRALDLECEIDFIRVRSYGTARQSAGTIQFTKGPELDLNGKDVLLVEDIVDTGITMAWMRDYFRSGPAATVRICALIDKTERRQVPVEVDYAGFQLDQGFLVGYGLDCAERYRHLPAIHSLEEKEAEGLTPNSTT